MLKLYLSLCIFISIIFHAQEASSTWFTSDDGLPQNSVKDIIKDKHGFIWFTTENGIVKYDGQTFQNHNDINIKNFRFSVFWGDIKKDIVYANNNYDENWIEISDRKIRVLKKNILFITHTYYNNTKYQFHCKNSFSEKINPNGNYCIKLENDEYLFNHKNLTYTNIASKKKFTLKKINNENLTKVFSINQSVYIIDNSILKIIKLEKGFVKRVNASNIYFDSETKIYWSQINNQSFLINHDDVYLIKDDLSLKKLTIIKNLKDCLVSSMYYDSYYNNLFIGSATRGLLIVKLNKFSTVNHHESSVKSIFYAVSSYDHDKVITPSGDIYNYKGFVKHIYIEGNTYSMFKDSSGNILTKKNDYLIKYIKNSNYNKSLFKKFSKPLDYIDYKNEFYIIGLYYGDTKRVLNFYSKDPFSSKVIPDYRFLCDDEIYSIVSFNHQKLLMGTRKGLYEISIKEKKKIKIPYYKDLSVKSVVKSKDNLFWILTEGDGLFLFRNGKLIKMPLDSIKSILTCHSLIEDKNNNIWITTNNGLYKINKTYLIRTSFEHQNIIEYYRYTKENGFLTNEFNGGGNPNCVTLNNGDFVFPSMNGLVFFNPNYIKSYFPNHLYVDRLKLYNKNGITYFKDKITLPNNFYKAQLYIDVPYFDNNDNLFIQAKIDNDSNEWETINKSKTYIINNLNSGEYVLWVRVVSSSKGDYLYKKIIVEVDTLFYQTLWFKVILFLMLLLFIYILMKIRLKKIKKKNEILEKLVEKRTKKLTKTISYLQLTKEKLKREIVQQKKLIGTITHDITTPIKYLSIMSKKLYESDEYDKNLQKKHFESLYKSSEQLYNFTKTLKEYADIYRNNNSKNDNYNLYELVEKKKLLFEEIAGENNTKIINLCNKNIVTNIDINILSTTIHNIIDNSVKNTFDGLITITTKIVYNKLWIYISDTGFGMKPEQIRYYLDLQKNIDNEKLILQKYGMGLHFVIQVLRIIDGKIYFTENTLDGSGTIAKIRLKNYFTNEKENFNS